jgi:hypothetical protein
MSKIVEGSEKNTFEVTWKFQYTEKVTPPRCRKPRDEQREENLSIKIPSVSDKEAPIAIVETETVENGRKVIERKYRLFNGKLWYDKKITESGLREDPLEAIKEEMEEKRYPWLDRESHMKRIDEWANSLLLVNGVPHCPLPGEPRIYIETECSEGIRISIERAFGYDQTGFTRIRECDYYPVNEINKALSEVHRIGEAQKNFDPEEKIELQCRFSFAVLISSALTVDYQADYEAKLEERFKAKLKRVSNELNSAFSSPKEKIKAVEILLKELKLQLTNEES